MTALCRRYGVSAAGFYAWRRRSASAHADQDRRLSTEITRLFTEHQHRYGSPRLHRLLTRAARLRAAAGVIFHSDRGSEYMGAPFCAHVARLGFLQSASVRGPGDNAQWSRSSIRSRRSSPAA